MADRVQYNLESMIPELEDYKNRGIFSQRELNQIIETRRKHEFKLQRHDKKLLDIIRYIKSECALEKIRDRRLKEKNALASLHDRDITNKIIGLYKKAFYKFEDSKILTQFTRYAMKRKLYGELKAVYAEICTRRPADIDLWVYCAMKLFEIDDVEASRAMFFRGIRMNSKNPRIRIEFFKMEVKYVEKIEAINKEMEIEEEDKDEVEKGEVAFAVFMDYYNFCQDDTEGLEEILEVASAVPELKDKIKQHINI